MLILLLCYRYEVQPINPNTEGRKKQSLSNLLGSKNLGTNEFRTLMCFVGKQ